MTPAEIVHEFIAAINQQHIDKMVSMMTPDHVFVDSLGKTVPTRRAMRDAWLGFFEIIPDYTVTIEHTFDRDRNVVVVGKASGTFTKDGELHAHNRWSVPAAWQAVIKGSRIDSWHAFVDNEPLRRIMGHCGAFEPEE